MNKYFISILIFIVSSFVLIGWIYNIPYFINFNSSSITIKPITSVFLIAISIISLCMYLNNDCENKLAQIIITMFSCWILLALLVVCFSKIILNINLEFIFYNNIRLDVIQPNNLSHIPSIFSLIEIFINAIIGLIYIFNTHKVVIRTKILGIGILIIGILYLFNNIINNEQINNILNLFPVETGSVTPFIFILQGINIIYTYKSLKFKLSAKMS